jgi:hypothetical protein
MRCANSITRYYHLGGGPNRDHRKSDNCSRFLWNWAATLEGRGAGGNVEQAANALRMRHCNGAIYVGQPLTLSAGIGDIHTASARILREIQFPLNALVDENAPGEDIHVWRPDNHHRWWTRNPRVGDRFLMHVFIKKGYLREILLRLNQARV